jgi:hypothetical protein
MWPCSLVARCGERKVAIRVLQYSDEANKKAQFHEASVDRCLSVCLYFLHRQQSMWSCSLVVRCGKRKVATRVLQYSDEADKKAEFHEASDNSWEVIAHPTSWYFQRYPNVGCLQLTAHIGNC